MSLVRGTVLPAQLSSIPSVTDRLFSFSRRGALSRWSHKCHVHCFPNIPFNGGPRFNVRSCFRPLLSWGPVLKSSAFLCFFSPFLIGCLFLRVRLALVFFFQLPEQVHPVKDICCRPSENISLPCPAVACLYSRRPAHTPQDTQLSKVAVFSYMSNVIPAKPIFRFGHRP